MWSPNTKVWSPEIKKNVESKFRKLQCNYADWWINHLIRPILYFPNDSQSRLTMSYLPAQPVLHFTGLWFSLEWPAHNKIAQ